MRDLSGPAAKFLRGSLLAAGLLALVQGALAQDATAPAAPAAEAAPAVTPDTVVATVGGETITEGDLAFAAEDMQQDLQQIPPEERKAFLTAVLIDMKVMAKAARDAQMDQTDVFKRRLNYLEERALRRAYFTESIAAKVTPEAVQTAYNEFTAGFTPQEERHAQHILVTTKEDADAIKNELATGKPFEVLAMEKSIDPSAAQNGGDLGFFQRGQMVKPFEDAAFGMTEVGQVSDPIQSEFGWHVIKLLEIRQSAPPPLDEVAPRLQQQVMLKAFEDSIGTLKAGLTIDIPDATLAAGVQRQSQSQQ
jgi:peptidyl-prolyl cis-trans isomerase C